MSNSMLGEVRFSEAWKTVTDIMTQMAGKDSKLVHQNLKLLASRRIGNWDEAEPPKKKQPKLDAFIRVDRSVGNLRPSWATGFRDPELQKHGPERFRLNKLDLWLHPDQEKGVVTGHVLYDYLRHNNRLESCLNLADGLEIQKKGIEVFRKFFGSNVVYLWKSVALRSGGRRYVPCLCDGGGRVALRWGRLGRSWDSREPALRFASLT